jgi:hypothetical protein
MLKQLLDAKRKEKKRQTEKARRRANKSESFTTASSGSIRKRKTQVSKKHIKKEKVEKVNSGLDRIKT